MTVVDTPDWFAGPQQAAPDKLVSYFNAAQDATFTQFGPFNCGGFPFLTFEAFSTTALLGVPNYVARFYTSAAMTKQIAALGIDGFDSTTTRIIIPVAGPWVRFGCQFHSGAGVVTASLDVTPVPNDDQIMLAGGELLAGGVINRSVAAGATATLNAGDIRCGRARLVVATTAAAWKANLIAVTDAGLQWGPLAVLGTAIPQPGNAVEVLLPCRMAQLAFTNNDGVAQTFSYSLTMQRR